jgi:hypothetical protein
LQAAARRGLTRFVGRDAELEQHDRAGIGKLLHPRREMRRLAYGRVVHVEIAADGAHDDLARVEPDADLDHRRVRASHLVRVLLDALLHPQCGVTRAHRVVFVGERRTEQGHDPVAHHLVDGSLEAVHRLHHVLEHGIEDLPRFFGIAIGEEFHRSLEVREEHRHLLPLAFEGGLRREDALGEVLRSVGVGRTKRGCRARNDCGAAGETEARLRGKISTATHATRRKPRTAAHAEARLRRILVAALRARHGRSLMATDCRIDRRSYSLRFFRARATTMNRKPMTRALPTPSFRLTEEVISTFGVSSEAGELGACS